MIAELSYGFQVRKKESYAYYLRRACYGELRFEDDLEIFLKEKGIENLSDTNPVMILDIEQIKVYQEYLEPKISDEFKKFDSLKKNINPKEISFVDDMNKISIRNYSYKGIKYYLDKFKIHQRPLISKLSSYQLFEEVKLKNGYVHIVRRSLTEFEYELYHYIFHSKKRLTVNNVIKKFSKVPNIFYSKKRLTIKNIIKKFSKVPKDQVLTILSKLEKYRDIDIKNGVIYVYKGSFDLSMVLD